MPAPTAAELAAVFPQGSLVTDTADKLFYAQDVHSAGPEPLAVFRPASIDELAKGMKAAAAAGLMVVPRGGGMSYTRGYVADAPGALIVDLGRMNRVLSVDETDMTVTVEAGISWGELHAALKPKGLRTMHWGTLSGINASVGGGFSQNGLFWGAAQGTMAPSAICFEVVLADGTSFQTGSGFVRPFGPDITGLFACDSGAFGIKAHVTLPLVREAPAFAYGSFAFDTPTDAFAAMSEVARARAPAQQKGLARQVRLHGRKKAPEAGIDHRRGDRIGAHHVQPPHLALCKHLLESPVYIHWQRHIHAERQ